MENELSDKARWPIVEQYGSHFIPDVRTEHNALEAFKAHGIEVAEVGRYYVIPPYSRPRTLFGTHFFRPDGLECGYILHGIFGNLHVFPEGRAWGTEFKAALTF
jgi:hypothetical protein